jgi:RNA polymerase sigma-70 factor (ECF subfamily)
VADHDADEGIRRLAEQGDRSGATTAALRRFGPEILGLLLSLHRDEDDAADAFSLFAEKLWRSLDRFEWRCSMRTWAYVLARRASHDLRRVEVRRRRLAEPLSPEVEELAVRVRTETMTFLRTETKSELAKLRETLVPDDQMLLVLRVDRKMEWSDLALVFLEREDLPDEPAPPHDDDVKREAARLRKRFQLVKERLHALAKERGLVRG